jgi:hypothetical protein
MDTPKVAAAEIDAVRRVVAAKKNSPFCKRRHSRNVENPPQQFRRDGFWKQMIVCMCTSVQRSGPNSRVSEFVREKPFPLSLAVCESKADLRSYAEKILRSRGLRFGPKIAKQIEKNFGWLRNNGWPRVEGQFFAVMHSPLGPHASSRIAAERRASHALMGRDGVS